jgi:hypothetical protein
VSLCLWGYVLLFQSNHIREFYAALLSVQWILLVCIAVWCCTFLFLTFIWHDWPLVGLLLLVGVHYFTGYTESLRGANALIFLAGVALGRAARFLLKADGRWQTGDVENNSEILNRKAAIVNVLVGVVVLLAFSSWWHLEVAHNVYPGTRWTGLWDNPNVYGMLMGAGMVLAIGLSAAKERKEHKANSCSPAPPYVGCYKEKSDSSSRPFLRFFAAEVMARDSRNLSLQGFLFIAAGMMAVGLVMSYSRGAWLATTIGLLYLAWCYGKFKWRWVLPGISIIATVVCVFWHSTADTGPWYLKRLDFSRPSAQHRVSAWRGALQMMRDHPLGVGWNQAVSTYEKKYSPPEGGAAALTMNSYLVLGTELGLPGLICFVAYVGLALKTENRKQKAENGDRK